MDPEIFLPPFISGESWGDQFAAFKIDTVNISGFMRQKKGTAQAGWMV